MDACYESKALKPLASTVLPGFYAIDLKGNKSSFAHVQASIARRFAIQQECWRDERPMTIQVTGQKAVVAYACTDEYVWVKPGKGRVMNVNRSNGKSYWVETKDGWRQEHLTVAGSSSFEMRVDMNWHIPMGGWKPQPTLREFHFGR
jgi:hypothetical protein